MKKQIHKFFTKYHVFITIGIICLILVIIGYDEYRGFLLKSGINSSINTITTDLDLKISNLDNKINSIIAQNNLLNDVVQTELIKNSVLADQVEQVNDTAEALDKLSKIDPQLLQKYSKVFFLNEHYKPSTLTTIPEQYIYDKNKEYFVHDGIFNYLEKMLKAALRDDIDIKVASAYRSFDDQASLKSGYKIVYGVGTANQFSADQGYSEHQLGTTLDFTTMDLKDDFSLFDQTLAYTWLTKNAYKYGFVLSYPKGNNYYIYEPWHWRFVGEDLAQKLHRDNKNFYDLDQRIINNYLGLLFD